MGVGQRASVANRRVGLVPSHEPSIRRLHRLILVPGNGLPTKKRKILLDTDLLAPVQELRPTAHQGHRRGGEGSFLATKQDHRGGVPSRFVVVGGELQPGFGRWGALGLVQSGVEVNRRALALPNLFERVVGGPAKVEIKVGLEMIGATAFGKENQASAGDGPQACPGCFPKIKGHPVRIIATETVDIGLVDPIEHGV